LTYRTGQKSFNDFITLYPQFRNIDGSALPASQISVLEWATWLGGAKRLQPKTIKVYITHLQLAHVDADLQFSACESPLLQQVIHGIKRYMGEKECNPKMLITFQVLGKILRAATHPSLEDRLNFEAATTTAFSGFLRFREFTIQPAKAFDPSIHIMRSCIQFMPLISCPSHIILTVPSSKTDPFRKGVVVTIAGTPGVHTCTVAALKSLFKLVQCPPELPLFIQGNGAPMSHGYFISRVKLSLLSMGFDASRFSGHSFHCGTASSAVAVGFNDY